MRVVYHCFILIILLSVSQISGFGKNKVQYTNLIWKQSSSAHFDIYFHQNMGNLPQIAYTWVENAYNSLMEQFQFARKDRIPLIIYGNPNLFAQTNIITEIIPEEVGGFTEFFKNRIAIPFNGSFSDFRHVLHHELVHAYVLGILNDNFGGSLRFNSIQIPFWFMEGSAEYLSSGWDTEADMFMMDQVIHSSVPVPGPALNGFLAYKGGQSFLFYLEASRGTDAFHRFLREFKKTKMVENSIKKVYGKDVDELGKEWIQELKRIYWPEIGKRIRPSQNATALTARLKTRHHFNLRPRISPDGSLIAFFSDRRDYTRILISDKTGKIVHQISQNGYGGYFESFHPFRSGICWSPDSRELGFVTYNNGRDEIRIVDVKKKKLKKKILTPVQSISSPDWSSDGNFIVFSGIDSGMSDLFLYDIRTDSLQRLTRNIQFEADPHFSPDGKKVIFSLQDTSGAILPQYGSAPSLELATIDLQSGKFERLTNTPWNEKQPCYSPDGNNILFISDRNGIDNIYIGVPDSLDKAKPLTNYTGGCSNPDWSQDGKSIVFSFYQQQGWDVLMIEQPMQKLVADSLQPTRWIESLRDTSQRFFAPVEMKPDSEIQEIIDTTVNIQRKGVSDITEEDEITESLPDTLVQVLTLDTIPLTEDSIIPGTDTAGLADERIAAAIQATGKTSAPDSTVESSPLLEPGTGTMQPTPTELLSNTSDTHNPDSAAEKVKNDSLVQHDSSEAMQPAQTLPSRPYRLKFTPDLITFGLGISTYYSPAGQWLLAFSDMMGDHQITVAGDIQGNFKSYMHLYASYYYVRQRLDLGIGGYYSKDYSSAGIFGDHLYHDTEFGGFFVAKYPFSLFSRIDFQVFTRSIERRPVGFDGSVISSTALLPSLSYIYDNILWGITGPLNGIRAKGSVLVSPSLHFISDPFVSLDADFRSYLHILKRFVWANRLFAGVSFPLGEKQSARRYLLGGNENWLFYQVNLDQYEKNIPFTFYSDFVTPFRGWDYLDISGSRAVVLNSEFRFPFIKEISVVWPFPMQVRYINGAFFADIGNAWEAGERNSGLPLPDKLYGGFGFGLRANLGIFVLRYDRGWPTDWKYDVWKPINYFSLGAEF